MVTGRTLGTMAGAMHGKAAKANAMVRGSKETNKMGQDIANEARDSIMVSGETSHNKGMAATIDRDSSRTLISQTTARETRTGRITVNITASILISTSQRCYTTTAETSSTSTPSGPILQLIFPKTRF